jgi:hypothetical protein
MVLDDYTDIFENLEKVNSNLDVGSNYADFRRDSEDLKELIKSIKKILWILILLILYITQILIMLMD